MIKPLSRNQQQLRGRKIHELTDEQLVDWISACSKMENWVGVRKARHGWKKSEQQARAELERRQSEQKQLSAK
jgi:hypothetical protein